MSNCQKNYRIFFLAMAVAISLRVTAQLPNFSAVPSLQPADSIQITQLIKTGMKFSKGKVIAWFPKDSLSNERMDKILDTLNNGIAGAERFIKAPHDWQVQGKDQPYIFYFRPDSFISHASGAGFVSIPFWRIQQGKAPWLHEALHEMLNSKAGNWIDRNIPDEVWAQNIPLWLFEGLPDYISSAVSQQLGLPQFDVFSNSLTRNADSACREDLERLTDSRSDSIISFIGTRGALTLLFGNARRLYAPAFYHCSCSFVTYLTAQSGVEPLVAALAAFPNEMEELDRRLSLPIEELKKTWLIKIKAK